MSSDLPRERKGEDGPGGDRKGVAILIVVFVLFAVGITAATTHQIVRGASELSGFSSDGAVAFAAAEAGLNRYIGEHFGGTPEEEVYDFDWTGAGPGPFQAFVSSRRALFQDDWNELHLVRSRGRVVDPRNFEFPTVRTARRYAVLRQPPFNVLAALAATFGSVSVQPGFTLTGEDHASPGNYFLDGEEDVPPPPAVGADISEVEAGSGVLDALQILPWDVLTDPDLPTESWPFLGIFSSDPPYRVIRHHGDLQASMLSGVGRGVLIVTGELSIGSFFGDNFNWEGIVIAGSIESPLNFTGSIRGIVVTGFDTGQTSLILQSGAIEYHSCNVWKAGRAASYLSPKPASWWMDF